MLLFGMFMAYQIKQNIKSFYNKYNDSPIVNLSSLLALFSFGSLALIVLVPTADSIGFLLLIIVLRDGIWMFPMLGFMYLPMVSVSAIVCIFCVCRRERKRLKGWKWRNEEVQYIREF